MTYDVFLQINTSCAGIIIGKYKNEPFTGSFDGDGFSIQNLCFNAGSYMGLFGAIEHPADDPDYPYSVKNLTLLSPTIRLINGSSLVGCLVGSNVSSTIVDCVVNSPLIEVSSSANVGCIAAINNHGTFRNCHVVNCAITGIGKVGGLIGLNNAGNLIDCTVTGQIEGKSYIGLLVGYNNGGIIDKCDTNGNTIGTEDSNYIGGLVGGNSGGNISNCSTVGTVSGNRDIGGIAGSNSYGSMQRCSTSCLVTGITNEPIKSSYIGGFIGSFDTDISSDTMIESCYATGNVSGDRACGGFIGYNS